MLWLCYKVRGWKRVRDRGSERCQCFLNSIHGTPNPLSSTNQLTDCHLPRSRYGRWGEKGLKLSTDTFTIEKQDRALPMLALEDFIPSKHRLPSELGKFEGRWHRRGISGKEKAEERSAVLSFHCCVPFMIQPLLGRSSTEQSIKLF